MSLSNWTLAQIWIEDSRPEEVAEPWVTVVIGIFMILTSAFGIFINLFVFRRFVSKNMTSFYIMCSSKTISNSMILFCYLIFNGPVSVMRRYYGPEFMNMLLNQMAAYGIYVQGPMTQVCISFNRFLIIYFATLAKRKNGRKATFVALSICWLISLFVTVAGIPGNCTNIFNYDILTWDNLDPCVDTLADLVMYWIGVLAVISNTFNVVVAIKLIVSATKPHMDSVASKRRRRTSRRLFLQSCFQDWIYLLDTINSMFIYTWLDKIIWQFFFTIFSNLFVHVMDGCIMLFFNYEKKKSILMLPKKKDCTFINVTF
ncbi:hypothetical protein CAEBREN_25390 [Caenorhabditis brenneri]|uniref:7TM GPCR serpentine receptor class x (Srx) domain-containing protein n=1 Tax=Caenorhabditis brenneri TaxID=135651 RepID=G0PAP8_CAEBE|nr:hypothetical protein CAEBREN_25390 [Caenorhabditis brenneri]